MDATYAHEVTITLVNPWGVAAILAILAAAGFVLCILVLGRRRPADNEPARDPESNSNPYRSPQFSAGKGTIDSNNGSVPEIVAMRRRRALVALTAAILFCILLIIYSGWIVGR